MIDWQTDLHLGGLLEKAVILEHELNRGIALSEHRIAQMAERKLQMLLEGSDVVLRFDKLIALRSGSHQGFSERITS